MGGRDCILFTLPNSALRELARCSGVQPWRPARLRNRSPTWPCERSLTNKMIRRRTSLTALQSCTYASPTRRRFPRACVCCSQGRVSRASDSGAVLKGYLERYRLGAKSDSWVQLRDSTTFLHASNLFRALGALSVGDFGDTDRHVPFGQFYQSTSTFRRCNSASQREFRHVWLGLNRTPDCVGFVVAQNCPRENEGSLARPFRSTRP